VQGIDEAWHHHPAGGVDLDGVARLCQILQPVIGPTSIRIPS
jgi:hypothetical protein